MQEKESSKVETAMGEEKIVVVEEIDAESSMNMEIIPPNLGN